MNALMSVASEADERRIMLDMCRSVLVVVVLALIAGFLSVAPAEAGGGGVIRYKIQNVNSKLCLSPAGGSTGLNVAIVQYACDGDSNRSWDLVEVPGGQDIYHVKNLSNALCLSPAGGATGLNATIVQYTCDQDQSRLWRLVFSDGAFQLIGVQSNLCLSPAGGSTGLNVTIVQYTCDKHSARSWNRFPAYQFTNVHSADLCLSVAGESSKTRNSVAVQDLCGQDPAQLWKLTPFGTSDSYYLQNVHSDLCLSPAGGATGPNTLVVQYTCDSNPVRAWQLPPADNPSFLYLRNVESGLCLSPAGGSTGLNAAMVLYFCDAHSSRLWVDANI